MTSEPLAPGAPAIILYRQVDRNDSMPNAAHQYNYLRIKILTEEGRKQANVEIPFLKETTEIIRINARTIKPDGTIVDFGGQVFDKTLVKGRGFGLMAKTFTLPSVEVGSVIEYYYTEDFKYAFDSHWILSQNLFTKTARFSLVPLKSNYVPIGLRWSWKWLPPGAVPAAGHDGIVRMEANNIPAFETEDYMPPADELKARVDFIYHTGPPESDPARFWQQTGKVWNDRLESFVGKHGAMEQAVAQIVSASDPPDVKLRKIYARVQEIRNKSYELSKTKEEQKREKEKPAENVEDVWKRGYGTGTQLTWLYLGLVRAAGFDAYGCWVSSRRQFFFTPSTMEAGKLRASVVLVKLDGKDLYFDPGAEFTPFGMLTWSETGVSGLCLDKNGGTLIQTALPKSSESRLEQKAQLKLAESGDLEGKITVTYTGLVAMYQRLYVRNADDLVRKSSLEDALKGQIPATAEVELTNKPDWNSSETPMVAEFDVKIPGWAANAGRRMMVPAGLFTAHEKHMFERSDRIHPIYFEYPYEKDDDVTIELASGWQVGSTPPEQKQDGHVMTYGLKTEPGKTSLHLVRKLTIDVMLLDQKYYPALRNFFDAVRTGDDQKIVLQPGVSAAK